MLIKLGSRKIGSFVWRRSAIVLFGVCALDVFGGIGHTLSSQNSASVCDTITFTNRIENTGGVLSDLIVTNTLPNGNVAYVPNGTRITLPTGAVLTNSAAEPDSMPNPQTLVWDFSNVTTPSALTNLMITEVYYDTTNAVEDANEWIEIYNPGASSRTLTGYSIQDDLPGQTDAIPTLTIEPGEFIILAASIAAFTNDNPTYSGDVYEVADGTLGSGLNNFADGIRLLNASSNVVDAMSYGGSTAAFAPAAPDVDEGRSLARNPANEDTGSANDWVSQTTPDPGTGSLQTGIENGGVVLIEFQVEVGCSAANGTYYSAVSYEQPPGSPASTEATSTELVVFDGNLVATKSPLTQSAGYLDTVVWTVSVQNVGLGDADNVVLTDTKGPGIIFTGFSVAPTNAAPYTNLTSVVWDSSAIAELSVLNPDETVSVLVTAQVVACTGLYNEVDARFGCEGLLAATNEVCENTAAIDETGGASIDFIYRYAEVTGSLSPASPIALQYCDGAPITLYMTNAPGGDVGHALNIEMTPDLPPGYSVTGAAVTTNGTIVLGDLAPGASTNVTVTLLPGGSCPIDLAQKTVTFNPDYQDACGTVYAALPIISSAYVTNEPSASIHKVVPTSVSGSASSMTVQVFYTYENFDNTSVTFRDHWPNNGFWTVTNITQGGSIVSTSIVWNATLDGSGVYTTEFDLVWTDSCSVPSLPQFNIIAADDFTDCQGCVHTVSGSGNRYGTQINPAGCGGGGGCGYSTIKTVSDELVEVCDSVTITQRVAALSGTNIPSSWAGSYITSDLGGGDGELSSTNSVKVFLDGSNVTSYVSINQTTPSLTVAFSNLNSSSFSTPGSFSNEMVVTWDVMVTNASHVYDVSSVSLAGCGGYSRFVDWYVGESDVTVELPSVEGFEVCGIIAGQIDLENQLSPNLPGGTNAFFPAYDVQVVLDLDADGDGQSTYDYVTSSTTFSNMSALGGGALSGSEPISATSTQVVWSLGDLASDGIGSVHYQLRASCDIGTNEQHRAYVRFNNKCEDGGDPRGTIAGSATNDLPDTLFAPTVNVAAEPEVSFIEGTGYVFRIEFQNSGAGTAYNLAPELALPNNIVFDSASITPSATTSTNVVWDLQITNAVGDLIDADNDGFYDDLPPYGVFNIYVTNEVTSCAVSTVQVRASSGCKGTTCDISEDDEASFNPLAGDLQTSLTFPGGAELCKTSTVHYLVKNAGLGFTYDVEADLVFPTGLVYVAGSSKSVIGGVTNSIADPSGSGTAASPYTWDSSSESGFAAQEPGSQITLLFDVMLDCETVNDTAVFTSEGRFVDNCGVSRTNTSTTSTLAYDRPVLTVSKTSRNITLGQSSFQSGVVPGNPGDVLAYRIVISHGGSSTADAQALKVTDVLPATVDYVGASVSPDSVVGTGGATIIWSNSTLMGLVGGAPYADSDGSITLFLTGQVNTCVSDTMNTATVDYGCRVDCLSLQASDTALHTFFPTITPGVGSSDGLILTACGGTRTVTITNTGGVAVDMVMVETAPPGYIVTHATITGEYTSTNLLMSLGGVPVGNVATVDLTTATSSGAVDSNDDAGDGLSNLDFGLGDVLTVIFTFASDGTDLDCSADPTDADFVDPEPGEPTLLEESFEVTFKSLCDDLGSESSSSSTFPLLPDLDINIEPDSQIVENGEVVPFTVRIENRAEDGNAENISVRLSFGSGWSSLSMTSSNISETGSGSMVLELQGSTNALISFPGVILDPLDDFIDMTFQGTVNEGGGDLAILSEVVGDCENTDVAYCNPTNIFGVAPLVETMNGSTIPALDGQYYSFDQERVAVAGYSLDKTVRLDDEAAPGGSQRTGRIGEDLIYRIESHFFGADFTNVVVTDSLPSGMVYGTPVDVGSSANISNLWSYNGSGQFTLPTPLTSDSIFLVDIPVIVSNKAANQGESGSQTFITNNAVASFTVNGVTDSPASDEAVVEVVEAYLNIVKTTSAGTNVVQAGDTLIITNLITHTGSSLTNAYDLVFTDELPDGLTFTGVDLGTDGYDNDGDGATDEADESTLVSGDAITVTTNENSNLLNVSTAETVLVVFPVKVLDQAIGATMVNTSTVTFTSLEGVGSNGNERDGSGGVNDYNDNDTVVITSEAIETLTKTLDSTSETNTLGSDLTIGERVVYRIRVNVPQGAVQNAVLTDLVPSGLDWVGGNSDTNLTFPGLGYQFEVPSGGPVFATNTAGGLVITDPDPSPTSSTSSDGSGDDIIFTIGSITNSPDGISTNDFFDLLMEFVVLDDGVNDGRTNNQHSDSNGVSYVDNFNAVTNYSATYDIVDHVARVRSKDFDVSTADAGDVVEVTIRIENRNIALADAYDLVVTDMLHSVYYDVSTLNVLEVPVGWTFSTNVLSDGMSVIISSDPGTALPPNTIEDVRFEIALAQTLEPNLTFTNTATLVASDSINGQEPSGISDRDRTNIDRTDTLTVPDFSISKSLEATSETGPVDSVSTNVQIGEVVSYSIQVTLPESVATNLVVTDVIPAGMGYVIGSVSNDTDSLNGTLGALSVTPSGAGVGGNGVDIVFSFDGLSTIVDDNVTTNNSFTLHYQTVVLDTGSNAGLAGSQTVLSNTANVTYENNPSSAAQSSAVNVQVIEPQVGITKSIAQSDVDAGDVVDITLVLTNSGLATAYQLEVSDPLDSGIYDIGSITPVSVPAGFVFSVSNDTVLVQSDTASGAATNSLEAGESLTVDFQVTIAGTVTPNQTITNVATVTAADTIDGTGEQGNERDASGATAQDTMLVGGISLSKSLVGTSETGPADSTGSNVQIGEVVSYTLDVVLPEAVITNLAVTDFVPAGMGYVYGSHSVNTTGLAGTLGTLNITPSGSGVGSSGQDMTFTWQGESTITDDNNTNNNSFSLSYDLVVLDVGGNTGLSGNQTILTNLAQLTFTGNPSGPAQSESVTTPVVEPQVLLDKSMDISAGDAGDQVTVTLVLTNSGLATAFDLDVQDVIMSDVFDASSIAEGVTPAGFVFSNTGSPDALVRYVSDGSSGPSTNSLEVGESLTFSFTVDLAQGVEPGQLVTNRSTVTAADSISGTAQQGNERDASGDVGDDDLTIDAIGVSKALQATSETGAADTAGSDVTIGEVVTYRLTVDMPESTVTNLVVTDVLPAGLAYESGSVSVDTTGFGGALPGVPSVSGGSGNGDDVVFTFTGVTVVSNDNVGANNSFTIDLDALVLDVVSNDGLPAAIDGDGQTSLGNRATVDFSGSEGGAVTSSTVSVTVVEPSLLIDKQMTGPNTNIVDVVLVVTNRGTSTAFDVVIEDTFPSNTWDTTTISGTVPTGFVYSVSGAPGDALLVITVNTNADQTTRSITVGETVTFNFSGALAEGSDGTVSNTAVITTNTTLDGSSVNERDEPDVQDTALIGVPNIVATKRGEAVAGVGQLNPNGLILYTITVTNDGFATATDVTITDIVPTNTTFVSGSVTNDGVGLADPVTDVVVNVGDVEVGATSVLTFLVQVDPDPEATVTNIYNLATVTWAESAVTEVADNDPGGHDSTTDDGSDNGTDVGEDTDDDDPTIIPLFTARCELTKTLISPAGQALLGESMHFRISVTNDGNVAFTTTPLVDEYDTTYLTFFTSEPPPVDSTDDGTLNWADLGPLAVGQVISVDVYFTAKATTPTIQTNTATLSPTISGGGPVPPEVATAPYDIGSSTLALVSEFGAYPDAEGQVLTWTTVSEIGTFGFNVYRADRGKWMKVNDEIILGLLNTPQGGTYFYEDKTAVSGQTYLYRLEEIEIEGSHQIFGPYKVTFEESSRRRAVQGLRKRSAASEQELTSRPHAMTSAKQDRVATRKREAATQAAQAAQETGNFVTIPVTEDSVYYLSVERISSILDLSVELASSLIQGNHLELRSRGLRIPYLPAAEGLGIYFYGMAEESIYGSERVYWLGAGRGVRMQQAAGEHVVYVPPGQHYSARIHKEQNLTAITDLGDNGEEDFWVWDQLITGLPGFDKKTYTVEADHVSSGEGIASIAIRVQGGMESSGGPDHRVVVRVNGVNVGSGDFDGLEAAEFTFEFSQSLLIEGENTIEVVGQRPQGLGFGLIYVDYFDVSYQRLYRAAGNVIQFPANGYESVRVDRFTEGDVTVLDITNPERPKFVSPVRVIQLGTVFSAQFETASPDSKYIAFTPLGAKDVVSPAAELATSLTDVSNRGDHIIITVEELAEEAQVLADYRSGQGYESRVVLLSDIYDAFNFGKANPEAIRRFLQYAYHSWDLGPEFVVLAGEGTYDYQNFKGLSDNLIPPIMISTPKGLFASDTIYGDVSNDDGVPDIAVGRLPVATAGELQSLIQKIIAYESGTGIWEEDVLIVADDPDSGGEFEGSSDVLAAKVGTGYTSEKIYLAQDSISLSRQKLIEGINQGASLVNYTGHGGMDRMAVEGMLTLGDMGSITNAGRPTVITAMTCLIGRFSVPGYDSLGESLLLHPDGGAIAVWSPTGISQHSLAEDLGEEFFSQKFEGGVDVIGDAIIASMSQYIGQGESPFVLYLFNLLGDPALIMK